MKCGDGPDPLAHRHGSGMMPLFKAPWRYVSEPCWERDHSWRLVCQALSGPNDDRSGPTTHSSQPGLSCGRWVMRQTTTVSPVPQRSVTSHLTCERALGPSPAFRRVSPVPKRLVSKSVSKTRT